MPMGVRRNMADVDVGSDRSFAFVEMRSQRLDAGPFDEAHHICRRKDRRHIGKPGKRR
jgi:hypothetical protein